MKDVKKTPTIEELKKQHEEAKNAFKAIDEQLKKAVEEEEERKQAQLALDKELRKKEVDEAFDNYQKLLKAYIEDYGSYHTTTDTDWFLKPFVHSFF